MGGGIKEGRGRGRREGWGREGQKSREEGGVEVGRRDGGVERRDGRRDGGGMEKGRRRKGEGGGRETSKTTPGVWLGWLKWQPRGQVASSEMC